MRRKQCPVKHGVAPGNLSSEDRDTPPWVDRGKRDHCRSWQCPGCRPHTASWRRGNRSPENGRAPQRSLTARWLSVEGKPVFRQPPDIDCQNLRCQIFHPDPGQNQETDIVDHLGQVLLPVGLAPATEAIPAGAIFQTTIELPPVPSLTQHHGYRRPSKIPALPDQLADGRDIRIINPPPSN
jgi:hypothetical protein